MPRPFQNGTVQKAPHKEEHVILAAMIRSSDDREESRHKSPGPGDAEGGCWSHYFAYVFAFVDSVRCN